jgi:hypothetical protein
MAEHLWDDLYEHVDVAVKELPALQRDAVVAHFLQGRAQADIARDLGVSPQAVSQRIRQGLDAVADSLKKRGVTVSAVPLGELLTVHVAKVEPIPPTLLASLGKLSLSQTGGASATAVATSSVIGGKAAVIGALVVIAALAIMNNYWIEEDVDILPSTNTPTESLTKSSANSEGDADGGRRSSSDDQAALASAGEEKESEAVAQSTGRDVVVGGQPSELLDAGPGAPTLRPASWTGPIAIGQDLHALDDRGSIAWSLFREKNVGPLLRPLSHRIRPLLDPARRDGPAWVGEDSDATIRLTIEFEDKIDSGVYVAFFSHSYLTSGLLWWGEPEHIRFFDGPGAHTIDSIPEGSYLIGAMTAKESESLENVPFAIGVHKSWPNPIGVQEGQEARVHVLVSEAFHAAVAYGSPRMPRDMNGLWDSAGGDFVQGQITHNSTSGIPVAIGAVSFRGRLDTHRVLAPPPLGIDPEGWYFYDGIREPYSVSATWKDVSPPQFSYREQRANFGRALKGSNEEHIGFEPFPTGTATILGHVASRVKNFFVRVETDDEAFGRVEPPAPFSYQFPFMNDKREFRLENMPKGHYRVSVLPFDAESRSGVVGSREVRLNLGDGQTRRILLRY